MKTSTQRQRRRITRPVIHFRAASVSGIRVGTMPGQTWSCRRCWRARPFESESRSSEAASRVCRRPGSCRRRTTSRCSSADRRTGGHSNTVIVDSPAGGPGRHRLHRLQRGDLSQPHRTLRASRRADRSRRTCRSPYRSMADGSNIPAAGLGGLFAQPRNLVRPRFWSMLRDLCVSTARRRGDSPRPRPPAPPSATISRPARLRGGIPRRPSPADGGRDLVGARRRDPRLSGRAPSSASSTITVCSNFAAGRQWRTVVGGSRAYVERLTRALRGADQARRAASRRSGRAARRRSTSATSGGTVQRFDHVVIATHADQALAMLDAPSAAERRLLGAFRYSRNTRGAALRPEPDAATPGGLVELELSRQRRRTARRQPSTYWMNRLQATRRRKPPLS